MSEKKSIAQRTIELRGEDIYKKIGKATAERTAELFGKDFHAKMGRRGGLETLATMGREFYRENGLKGGASVSKNRERMAAIGRLGGKRSGEVRSKGK